MFSRRKNKYIFAKPKKGKKFLKVLGIIVLICAIALGGYFLYQKVLKGGFSRVTLAKPAEVEINSDVNASSMIKSIKGAKLYKDEKIDTSKLGKTKVTVKIKLDSGKVEDYSFDVDVVDKEGPKISCGDEIFIILGSKFDPAEMAGVTDNSGGKVKVKVEGDYDVNKQGEYPVTIIAEDSAGNKTEKKVTLKVQNPADVEGQLKFTTGKGFNAVIEDGILTVDGVVIANKSFPLPADYDPGITGDTDGAFHEMRMAAKEDGINIFVLTGYVSYNRQAALYNDRGDAGEDNPVYAKPGCSDYQTGEALDINSNKADFDSTEAGKWLNENASKYGFVLRYPEGQEKYTGFSYQPGHYRYVGKDLAEKLYKDGKWTSLEEYFGIPSQYGKE